MPAQTSNVCIRGHTKLLSAPVRGGIFILLEQGSHSYNTLSCNVPLCRCGCSGQAGLAACSCSQTKQGRDKLQDEIDNGSREDVGVKSVKQASMPWDEV